MSEIQLNTIEEAIEDFREGKFLIVVDDEDRETAGRMKETLSSRPRK